MKQISCNVIKDILPLYLDDVVSQDTREMVEEHLRCLQKGSMRFKKQYCTAGRQKHEVPGRKDPEKSEETVIQEKSSHSDPLSCRGCRSDIRSVLHPDSAENFYSL